MRRPRSAAVLQPDYNAKELLTPSLGHPEPSMRQLTGELLEIRAMAMPLLTALLDGLMRRRPMYIGDEAAVVGLLRFGLKLWADQRNARRNGSRRLHLLLQRS